MSVTTEGPNGRSVITMSVTIDDEHPRLRGEGGEPGEGGESGRGELGRPLEAHEAAAVADDGLSGDERAAVTREEHGDGPDVLLRSPDAAQRRSRRDRVAQVGITRERF